MLFFVAIFALLESAVKGWLIGDSYDYRCLLDSECTCVLQLYTQVCFTERDKNVLPYRILCEGQA